jgi:hypothetical protein
VPVVAQLISANLSLLPSIRERRLMMIGLGLGEDLLLGILVVVEVQKYFLDSEESSEWREEVIRREVCECKKQIHNNGRLFINVLLYDTF